MVRLEHSAALGGVSDPFQPCEEALGYSYECLKVFEQTQYPFVVSTKGKLVASDKYLDILKRCNCVVQISAVCSKYDILEKGAPTFEERLEMIRRLSANVKRVIVRVQPYMAEVFDDVYENIPRFSEAGAYGIIIEGMKFVKKKPSLIKIGADFTYQYDLIKEHFLRLQARAHKYGLKCYAGENRIRSYGDSLTCCGIDGLEGFRGNDYNINHIILGDMKEPTATMKQKGTAGCFKALK